jgi:hypothetical protein
MTSIGAVLPLPIEITPPTLVACSADVAGQPPSDNELINQERLGKYKTWLLMQSGLNQSGYVSTVGDATTLTIQLLWRGQDDLLQTAVDQAAACGITAVVEPRPLSMADLRAVMLKIDRQRAALAKQGLLVTFIHPIFEGTTDIVVDGVYTGALAGVANPEGTEEERELADKRAKLAADLAEAVGAPIQVRGSSVIVIRS